MFTAYIMSEQDRAESASLWDSIDTENTTRPVAAYSPAVEPVREGRGGVLAAKALGWNIDPENSPGNPHAFGTGCDDKRCSCHGRTFAHYRRGA